MKEFLMGMGIGFVVGAIMVKSNKDLSNAVEKGKKAVDQKIEECKDFIEEKMIQPSKKSSSSKK